MYAWIWRRLPFGLWGKLTGSVVLVAAAVALLWFIVFPWAEPLLPFDDVQVSQDAGGSSDPGVPVAPSAGTPGVADNPALDEHAIPYSTRSNNPPPTSSGR